MRQVLFDRSGRAQLYLTGGGVLYSIDNAPLARVHEDALVSFTGDVVGWFKDGFLWDDEGYVVAFAKGARPREPRFELPRTLPPTNKLRPVPAPFLPLLRPNEKPHFKWQWSDRPAASLATVQAG